MEKKMLKTDRGLLLYIIFSIITLGIYPIVMFTKVSNEVNLVVKDGRSTMQYWIVWLLTIPTLGILPLVWFNNISSRVGNELVRRNLPYSISAGTFWGWGFFGVLLFGIGPLVYIHKLLKAVNILNTSYNMEK